MLVIIDCLQCKDFGEVIETIESICASKKIMTDFALINSKYNMEVENFSFPIHAVSYNSIKHLVEISKGYKYLFFVKSGSIVDKKLFNVFSAPNLLNENLYALKELSYDYCLNKNFSSTGVIQIQGELRIWSGSNGFICSSKFVELLININIEEQRFFNNFFLEILRKEKRFLFIEKGVRSLRPLEDKYTDEAFLYDKDWYISLNTYWCKFFSTEKYSSMDDSSSRYFNLLYLYHLGWCFWHNYNYKNKTRLWQEQKHVFFDGIKNCLKNISGEEIFIYSPVVYANELHQHYRFFLYKIKYSKEKIEFSYNGKEVFLEHRDKKIFIINDIPLDIELINIENDKLILHCFYRGPLEELSVQARCGGERFLSKKYGSYYNFKSMGISIASDYNGIIKIPLANINSRISFYLVTDSFEVQLNIRFTRMMSKLSCPVSYWKFGGSIFQHDGKNIIIQKRGLFSSITSEIRFLAELFKQKKYSSFLLRTIFWLTRPYFKRKKIWIYSDKIYKAGDNAEYLYKYSLETNDDNQHYYILRDDALDAERFRNEGLKYVKYSSLRHKLLFLNAEVVFLTHILLPLNHLSPKQAFDFKDIFNYKTVCLQHGLSVQDAALFLCSKIDNISLYCLAAPVEMINLSRPEYKFEKNVFVETGLARYDGLVNNPKKQILIAPTWRNYLAAPAVHGNSREYAGNFVNSNYYLTYKRLITSKKLQDKLFENDYTAVFLLHPVFSAQVRDFPQNNYFKILSATALVSYEEILTESSLLVTDYSGIQFDFAYMNKPILYYHPDNLPPSYEEGAYTYSTMALGNIYTEETTLVDAICNYIENDCKLSKEHQSKIDDFFYYRDQNNCKRIYNATINFINKGDV